MIQLDGSHDEGGGQILRTAVGLSAYTGKPFKIFNIRARRKNPGLQAQHLEAVNAVARLCNAEVKGNALHSKELEFVPHEVNTGRINVKIPTAGSVGLVLQALMIPASLTTLKIKIEGGATYGKWAPPMDYLANVLFPLLGRMGYNIEVGKIKDGFYPKGGALVEVSVKRSSLKPIELIERGEPLTINGISVASSNLEKARVAERQAMSASKILFNEFGDLPLDLKALYREAICPGTGITLWAECENSIIGADSLGELGKKSEQVGKEAAIKLIKEFSSGAAVDSHAADQLLPYIAIADSGKLKTTKITGHIRTNAFVIEKFLDVKFRIAEQEALVECFRA
ncbi:MAG: RNA 3'-terminal phosphate cyclase [Nanoarchaeota archaeon]|nr:RNA 3'-terminal phosphate cyclase [Nanoarchaeota archaeon]